MVNSSITTVLSGEFPKIQPEHLCAILELHEEQASVSYIARYKADAIGGLDEPRVGAVIERYNELCVLWARKRLILNEMENNGVTSPELAAKVEECLDKFELEDLYLPFRPRSRTRATTADEQGLKPLAEVFWDQQVDATPEELAAPYINPEKKIETVEDALEGAIHIMSEWIAFNPTARKNIRNFIFDTGLYQSKLVPERQGQSGKYETYYDFSESIRTIPSHRVLAIRRGVKEHWLQTSIIIDTQAALEILRKQFIVNPECKAKEIVERAIVLAFDKLMWKTISNEIAGIIAERADREAIDVFCKNLRNLLLSPPAGNVPVVGIEPSTRPDAAAAAIDPDGNLLESISIITKPDDPQHAESAAAFAQFIEKHASAAIIIGNGPESRAADEFVRQFLRNRSGEPRIARAVVNESGANIYATSKLAKEELPNLDTPVRCAVTIARRFQDPLAELVKIDPRAIGVGQYQHDVDQRKLIERLRFVIRCCVNYTGADIQKASACMLSYISGFNRGTAKRIVEYRDTHGPFKNLEELKNIPAVNETVFSQAAGFLRLKDSTEPLDDTAIHPEHYELAKRIAADHGIDLAQPDSDRSALKQVEIEKYISENAGPLAIKLILRELRRPRREARRRVDLAQIASSITSFDDLKEGQILEGTVTNVTNFGAFVDIGVHQDGLVHVSELSHSYVRDPNDAVKIGETVRVKVLQVDRERQRISLSIKQTAKPPRRKPARKKGKSEQKKQQPQQSKTRPVTLEDIQKLIDKLATR